MIDEAVVSSSNSLTPTESCTRYSHLSPRRMHLAEFMERICLENSTSKDVFVLLRLTWNSWEVPYHSGPVMGQTGSKRKGSCEGDASGLRTKEGIPGLMASLLPWLPYNPGRLLPSGPSGPELATLAVASPSSSVRAGPRIIETHPLPLRGHGQT